jgi:hypothetical protein
MNLATPPELADGGYWYLLPVVIGPEQGGKTPGIVPGVGWCAWYLGDQVVIRTPQAVEGLNTLQGKVSDVLDLNKPYARVGGA